MTNDEAIKTLREDYCGNRIICELYPDQCNREDCEIWLAIKALVEQPIRVLETQPDGDTISRQAALNIVYEIDTFQAGWRFNAMNEIKALPSAKPESTRTFVELVVRYPDPELCTYKKYRGKPYYSIKYIENGETYVGYGTYNPEVLSQYLKEYFISSAQPERSSEIQDILEYLDTVLHPIISPDHWNVYSELHDMISMLPSAQPDLCDGCDRYGTSCVGEGCGKLEMPEVAKDINVPINDCISRQAAIDAFKEYEKRVDTAAQVWTIRGCKDEILKLPSAQPEDCDTCKHGYFGDNHCETCRVRYPSHYERRTE